MIAVSANLHSGSYIHQQERPVFLVNNWKPNDLLQWNFKYQLVLLKYGSVSAARHLHKTQFSISSMTSCVLKHADPDIINFFHKPFYLLMMKSSVTLFSDDFLSVIQDFSQFNPPMDGSDFRTGPALSSGSDEVTSRSPFQPKFWYNSTRKVVIRAMIKMLWPWKTMGSSL